MRRGTSGEDQISAQGAGDQGMMFGFACDETDDLMPLPIWLAHRLAQRLSEVRKAGVLPYLRPDGKTQVTFEYEDGRPVRLKTVLISSQHQPGLDIETLLKPDLREHVINPLLPEQFADDKYQLLANPTGSFVLGGPHADTGLTGRKIIVDTYGGAARHGGGAFSGKDPSKVDRSAAYAARWVAKHVVAAGRRPQVRDPGGLRHRRGPAGVDHGRDVRHRDGRPAQDQRHDPARSSTSARRPSSATSTCASRSTGAPPPTATSGATTKSSPGSTWAASTTSRAPSACSSGSRGPG